jgi:hypothetical protein
MFMFSIGFIERLIPCQEKTRQSHGEFILIVNPSILGPQGAKLFYHEEHEEHEDSLPSWPSCSSWFFKKIILAHFKAAAEKTSRTWHSFLSLTE